MTTSIVTPYRDRFLAVANQLKEMDLDDSMAGDDPRYVAALIENAEAREAYIRSDEPRTWVAGGEIRGAESQFALSFDFQAASEGGDWGVTPEGGSVVVIGYARCVETGEEVSGLVVVDNFSLSIIRSSRGK